jgi:Tol biopolymer transport system component
VWAVRVEQGRAAGKPRLVRDGLDRPLLLGLTAAGDLYYGVRSGQTDVHVTEIGSSASSAPFIADTPGRNFGAVFSPDGSALAYLSLRGSENYGVEHRAVLLYSLDQKVSRELPVRLAHIERLAWAPDSSRLLLAGSDRRARSGLFEFELKSQETQPAVLAPGGDFRGLEGTYSASGKEVIYARPAPPALVSLTLADRAERVLYQPSSNAALSLPAVSPEGGRLAFVETNTAGGPVHILLLDIASRQTSKLLSLPSGRFTDLNWMPGGESLLVGTEGSQGAQLWKVSEAGDSMQPAPSPAKRRPGISVHPDGRRVALTIGETEEQILVLEHAAHAATDSH